VQDNLNTPKPASLYEAFSAAEARRLVERFEWHYTPKHGSWLEWPSPNSASFRPNDRRIPDHQTLIHEIAAWEEDRNANQGRLAVHHTRSTYQTQASIPVNLTEYAGSAEGPHVPRRIRIFRVHRTDAEPAR
jgi:hypothetical protein